MSDNPIKEKDGKIIGIPAGKFALISYYLILASSGFGLLLSLLGVLGIGLPGNAFFGAIGLLAVVLSLLGLFVFESKFNALDKSHFKFIALAYVAFFVIAIVLGTIFALMGSFGYLLVFLIATVQVLTFYAGFTLYQEGKEATQDNLMLKYEGYKGFLFSKFKKAEESVKKTAQKVEDKVDDDDDDIDGVDKSA